MNALDLFKLSGRPTFISLGCPYLDSAVGGIPAQGITEISGEAGCGKTQLCLTLALQVQLDEAHGGRNGSAAYLSCGEGTFPIRRLSQVAASYEAKTGIPNQKFLSNVHIEHCYNTDDAQSILRNKIPELCQTQGVRLLIIDSLAGLVRFEYDNRSAQEMKARTVLLFNLAKQLKLLADIFKLSIVVVNQVKADFIDTTRYGSSGEGNASIPALGMAWSYCVNTRISLHRNTAAMRAIALPVTATSASDGDDQEGGVGNDSSGGALVGATNSVSSGNIGYIGGFRSGGSGSVVKVEHVSSSCSVVGVKRGYDHAYIKAFDDDFYYDRSDVLSVPYVPSELDTSAPRVCGAAVSSADKENTSGNSATFSIHSSAGIAVATSSVLVKSEGGVPRCIQYYSSNSSDVATVSTTSTGAGATTATAKSTRCMRLEFSPCKASAECAYEISHAGIHGVPF